MPSIYTVDDRVLSLVIPNSGYEKMCVTVMLAVLADVRKLPPYVILHHKTCLRSNCLEESLSDVSLKVG
jgi:hypothetical protein